MPTQTLETLQHACRTASRLTRAQEGVTHNGVAVNPEALLWTIAGLESSFGERREYVKHETAYMPNGIYYRNATLGGKQLRELYHRYGVLAASSFGAFQIMYITAYELGFRGHPIELQNDLECARWAATLIGERYVRRPGTERLIDILDAYNSGNFIDQNVPADYMKRGVAIYENAVLRAFHDAETKAA